MKRQSNKWLVLLAVGMNCIFWGMTLNNFGIVGDGVDGFLTGFGVTIILGSLFIGKAKNRCKKELP